MPFESQAQRRFMYAKHPEMAKRWEAHTPKGKKLPEHKGDKVSKGTTKKAEFVRQFLLNAAKTGVTGPAALTKLAQQMTKSADFSDAVGKAVGGLASTVPLAAAAGTIGLPAVSGWTLGQLAGRARNQVDEDDAKSLQTTALANAYRRQAALAKSNTQVRQLVASDPKKYVVIG